MPIFYNNSSIASPVYNGVELDDIYYNNTLVFSKPREIILINNKEVWFGSVNGSLEDGVQVTGFPTPPKLFTVDCTPYTTLECECKGEINDTWQPNSTNDSELYLGFRDTPSVTSDQLWGSPLPHRVLMHGNKSGDDYRIDGGDFWHKDGYLIKEYQVLTLDISQLTGTHIFRVWASFDNLEICYVSWDVRIKSLRMYR